jgi:alpha-tubulin suppressor-like RCC1 family protein
VEVSAGRFSTCARLQDGTLGCWGYNNFGQLGNGTTSDSSTSVAVSGINNGVEVSMGDGHACARLQDGTLRCWGYGRLGELGILPPLGDITFSSTPVIVEDIGNAVEVSAGANHTCARLQDGTVRCWGDNSYGQLGDGTETNAFTPVTVSGW